LAAEGRIFGFAETKRVLSLKGEEENKALAAVPAPPRPSGRGGWGVRSARERPFVAVAVVVVRR
jgi:hypothetical protein